jgi:glycosyltransferase involved in cell wall biosynthesis
MFIKFINNHERGVLRALEILPGLISWNLILFPYWGIFVIPVVVAYFILLFNIYWFYQSFQIAISASIAHIRIQAAMKYDWVADLKSFPDWKRVNNVIIIPTYREPLHTLDRTLDSLAKQTLPLSQLTVVIAQEKRAPKDEWEPKMEILRRKYRKQFGNFFVAVHELVAGETIGKASNERYAAMWVERELINKRGEDINYMTVTSCDADHVYHKHHFAYLAFKFLDNPKRYQYFWQPSIMFYNNIWNIPAMSRVLNSLFSIYILSMLPRKDPEDWGIFFKAFYKKKGDLEVDAIYLPVYVDAVESTSTWRTLKNQYSQVKRWAWGVSDSPWIIKNYLTIPEVPFWDKTMRLITLMWAHFLWPVNWFTITIGLTLPTLINPAFGRTTLGHTVPQISSFVLTLSLVFLLFMIVLDYKYKPARPKEFPLWRALLVPFEFVLLPVAGFIFGALPGIDAHTRLMMGKYIQYKVTEKV